MIFTFIEIPNQIM